MNAEVENRIVDGFDPLGDHDECLGCGAVVGAPHRRGCAHLAYWADAAEKP